ncbi:MAG: helix-turn-helix domain-containing protein [Treponema sp.]|jgi:excisionase family DNA binding protein|nr:helix-turn-helix domain-containing protein [Treponema sp.]
MAEKDTLAFPKPLTLKDAMELTGFSRSYIYKLVHWKKIPYHKPTGGRLFFKQNELEEFCYRGKHLADYEIEDAANAILNQRNSI